ncbi:MAG: hypothetical protein MJ223_02900 [Mycoplasmoidaceae bacterium]|nr:hypothetical protein [Mycoplasmoidaceae bacterium]
MSEQEKAKAFAGGQLAFGTAGIRAKMGPGPHYMNTFVYKQMMIGYCKHLLAISTKKPSIIIGHDNRIDSDVFAKTCADVATAMGVNAYLMENNKLLPTPILSYAIRKYGLDGGVNITASHNPKEDNGFKAYNKLGAQILPNEAKDIIAMMPPSSDILDLSEYIKARRVGEYRYIPYDELVDSFFDAIIEQVVIDKPFLLPKAPIKNFPIVFTGFHGTTTELMPKLLKRLGFKKVYVYPKHANISGKFEDCPISNPEDPRAFAGVTDYALDMKSTFIIGCDPDGDRMTIGVKKTNR